MRSIALSVMLVSLLAACAGQQTKEQAGAAVEERAPGARPAEQAKPAETRPLTTQPVAVNPLKDPGNILSKRSVYYDFDSFVIKDEYKAIVEVHARYLRDNPRAKVLLQGNADERGSREYNLALGQKRAESVKKAMELLGVQDRRMEAVSLGEEKPRALGHDEPSWAENRRSDIVYDGE
ncbi:MAG: peptidoglycan-associated lipoprotein Pal [Betaproteobacteria bacterium]|nr:peptidoglycan-associated lipoprotein Pal [Betaproteobacteria bacterium]